MNLNITRLTIRKYINLSTSILLFTMFLKLSEESDSDINQEDSSHIKLVDLEAGINNLSFQDYVTHGHFQTINLIFFFKYIRQLDEHFSNKQTKELDFRSVVLCKYFVLLNELLIQIIKKAGILENNMQYDAIINLIVDSFRTKTTNLFQLYKSKKNSNQKHFVNKKIAEIIHTHDRIIEGILVNLKNKSLAGDSKESKMMYLLVNLNDIIEKYEAENPRKTMYKLRITTYIKAKNTKIIPIVLRANNFSLMNSCLRMEFLLLNDYGNNRSVNTFFNDKIAECLVITSHFIYFIEDYSILIETYDKGKICYNKIKEDGDLLHFEILLNPYEAIERFITKFREQLNKLMEDKNIKQVLNDVMNKTNEKLQGKGLRFKTMDEFFVFKFDCDDYKEISDIISIEKKTEQNSKGLKDFITKLTPILIEFHEKLSEHIKMIFIKGKEKNLKEIIEQRIETLSIRESIFLFIKILTSHMNPISNNQINDIMKSIHSIIRFKNVKNIEKKFINSIIYINFVVTLFGSKT